jgi:DNA primase
MGIKLQPHGKNLIGLCPFHDDKEPSLVITPEKNLFNCLGACGSVGTVIDWVMKAEKLSFREAVAYLQKLSPSFLAASATKK